MTCLEDAECLREWNSILSPKALIRNKASVRRCPVLPNFSSEKAQWIVADVQNVPPEGRIKQRAGNASCHSEYKAAFMNTLSFSNTQVTFIHVTMCRTHSFVLRIRQYHGKSQSTTKGEAGPAAAGGPSFLSTCFLLIIQQKTVDSLTAQNRGTSLCF